MELDSTRIWALLIIISFAVVVVVQLIKKKKVEDSAVGVWAGGWMLMYNLFEIFSWWALILPAVIVLAFVVRHYYRKLPE